VIQFHFLSSWNAVINRTVIFVERIIVSHTTCALQKIKKSAVIAVIPSDKFRELLPEEFYERRKCRSERMHERSEVPTTRFLFAFSVLLIDLKLVSSTASGIPVLFPPLPLGLRHNFRNFRNESASLRSPCHKWGSVV